jgi:glutathione S-transferase
VKAKGEEIFAKGLALMDKALAGKDYLLGHYSFADSALFYTSFWWNGRLKKELPGNVAAHYARMNARPAVQRVLQAEGLA